MKRTTWAAAAALLIMLSGCAETVATYQPQENWADDMAKAYPPGTPAGDVEASVTAAGMRFEEVPNAYRILPRSVTTDGSGYWRRVVTVEETFGCRMERRMYFRFDDGDQLMTHYPGNSSCI